MEKLCTVCNLKFIASRNNNTCSNYCSSINRKIKLKLNYEKNKNDNKEKRVIALKNFHINNPDYKKVYMKKYRQTDKYKKYNRELKTTDRYKIKRNEYQRSRYSNDLCFKLYSLVRSSLHKNIKRETKKSRSLKYLGCSIKEWVIFLENKFDKNMSWYNYGTYWDIDHIIPLSSFDLLNEEEVKKAFNYTNTQPLESKYNRYVKKDKQGLEWQP